MGRRILLSVLVLLMLTTGLALAKGWPVKVAITGPGLPGETEITDPALVETLSNSFDVQSPVPALADTSHGYELTFHLASEPGGSEIVDFMHQRYYPNPTGGRGYIFHGEGILVVDGRDAGDWFYAREEFEMAMKEIIKYSGQPPTPSSFAIPAVLALGLTAIGFAWWYLRLRRRPSPTTNTERKYA